MHKRLAKAAAGGILLLSVVADARSSARGYPATYLEVTVRQREGAGALEKGIHIFNLHCGGTNCRVRVLTLNQCIAMGPGGQSFYPDISEFSIADRNLTVMYGDHSIVARYSQKTPGGTAEITLQFDYKIDKVDKEVGLVGHLVGFHGGYVKESTALKRAIRMEYVPIREFERVPMDCPAGALPTVPGSD
jgi:hypothetical protein